MRKVRAFSLLEVMFAVALFGAVVTVILSAQAGLVAGNKSAANMGQATAIGRCKMAEVEEKQMRLGFPEIEEKDSSTYCCDDKEVPGFSCEWRVERVTLPEATSLGGDAGLSSLLGGGLGLSGDGGAAPAASGAVPSPIGSVLVNPAGGAALDFDSGLAMMGQSLNQMAGGAGASGLLSMVFSLVYPSLKPLLETAIRRVTVTVRWKEGVADREFTLMQYLTNPLRAGLLAGLQ
ncbi:MAG TPA: prepilin-type N-terminal cleavage/methylation domain-containing protein, partial [Polyangiaceae bacterium]|nr:prepilin-type N-terminal cleavage/methylation domain-containing protein [Polyangiaceae bacterium]